MYILPLINFTAQAVCLIPGLEMQSTLVFKFCYLKD